jgi:hypothetical protein
MNRGSGDAWSAARLVTAILALGALEPLAAAAPSPAAGCSESDRDSRVSTIDTLKYVGLGAWIAGSALAVASGLHYRFSQGQDARHGSDRSMEQLVLDSSRVLATSPGACSREP